MPPLVKAWSLNHWMARQVQECILNLLSWEGWIENLPFLSPPSINISYVLSKWTYFFSDIPWTFWSTSSCLSCSQFLKPPSFFHSPLLTYLHLLRSYAASFCLLTPQNFTSTYLLCLVWYAMACSKLYSSIYAHVLSHLEQCWSNLVHGLDVSLQTISGLQWVIMIIPESTTQ